MMLNLKEEAATQERKWLSRGIIIGPAILSALLLGELVYIIVGGEMVNSTPHLVDPKAVALSLYGPYVIGVELSGILLMAGIVGAYHLGRQKKKIVHRFLKEDVSVSRGEL